MSWPHVNSINGEIKWGTSHQGITQNMCDDFVADEHCNKGTQYTVSSSIREERSSQGNYLCAL